MYLQSLANRTPRRAYSQHDCWDIFRQSRTARQVKDRSLTIMEKVLTGDNGITKRHFACEDLEGLFDRDAEVLNRDFEFAAPRLASEALGEALEKAGQRPQDLDALLVCTCTGYLCPGLSSYISERVGLDRSAFLQDIVGLGCGAAIPTLRSASHLVGSERKAMVAVIAVEICSAAFYLDDDPGVLISLCLFGDGASASIWNGHEGATGLRATGFDTLHIPENRELLRFENRGGKLRNKLHKSVPEKAAIAVEQLYSRNNKENVYAISHAGGRDVLEAVSARLPGQELREAAEVLRDYGNMSSPSVLFALERYLSKPGVNGTPLWLTSFGAGFAAHSMALEAS